MYIYNTKKTFSCKNLICAPCPWVLDQPLASNLVKGILEDSKGTLWNPLLISNEKASIMSYDWPFLISVNNKDFSEWQSLDSC